jgi:hypothetical protein
MGPEVPDMGDGTVGMGNEPAGIAAASRKKVSALAMEAPALGQHGP